MFLQAELASGRVSLTQAVKQELHMLPLVGGRVVSSYLRSCCDGGMKTEPPQASWGSVNGASTYREHAGRREGGRGRKGEGEGGGGRGEGKEVEGKVGRGNTREGRDVGGTVT